MKVLATLCQPKGEWVEVLAPPSAARIRAIVAEHQGYGLLEPDLPLGKLALPRDPVDRAVLAIVTRGRERSLLFVRGASARLGKPRPERALDLTVTLVEDDLPRDPLFDAAMAVLREQSRPLGGKELLREARARRGTGSNTEDGADLGRALIRAWNAGLIELG